MDRTQNSPNGHLPIVDCTKVFSSSIHDRQEVATQIRRELLSRSYIYVTNHGIPEDAQSRIKASMERFFKSDLEAKMKIHESISTAKRGYQYIGEPREDDPGRRDFREVFKVMIDANGCRDPEDKSQQGPEANQWPDDNPDFRDTAIEYSRAVFHFSKHLMRTLAIAIGVNETFFDHSYTSFNGLSLLYYPPALEGQDMGRAAHTDYSWFTVVNQLSPVPGLEVRNMAGDFEVVPYIPNTLVIIIGDFLQRASGNLLQGTMHRVQNRTDQERYSAVFFFDPHPDVVIEVPLACQTRQGSIEYEKVRAGELKSGLYLL